MPTTSHIDVARTRARPSSPDAHPATIPTPAAGRAAIARHYVLTCLPHDAAAVTRVLRTAIIERECPGARKHRRLDRVIPKPWGLEFRIYDDALLDAWLLLLEAGQRTSEHAHARKDTDLLCLSGRGEVTAGDGRGRPIVPGSTVHIAQGAVHRTTAITGLTLVEIETPRDKLDVVRVNDENGRAGRGYEQGWRSDPRLAALEPVADGPPGARLRPRCMDGRLRFGVERGADVAAHPHDLIFAVDLDAASILRRRLRIASPHDRLDIAADHLSLTIRRNYQEVSP